MKVAGIVCEFNPFHKGHERIISYCREELGADAVVACMSGNFVQRGEPAVIGKYERALAAMAKSGPSLASPENAESEFPPARAGADLMIELPVIGATANAEVFARTGVNTLLATGIVTDLVFGSESGDAEGIESAARLLYDEPKEFKEKLKEGLKAGLPYPAAMANALKTLLSESPESAVGSKDISTQLNNPNDLLGILYVKALLENEKAGGEKVSFHAVKRIGAMHDSEAFSPESSASAAAIRKHLAAGAGISEIRPFLPASSYEILSAAKEENTLVFPDDISMLLHEKLYSCSCEKETSAGTSNAGRDGVLDLTRFSDIDNDLANRILNMREDFTCFTEFAEALDTRNYTRARLRRALLHLVLGIKDDSVAALKACNYAPYIHVLAMNETGAGLLGKIKEAKKAGNCISGEGAGKIPERIPVFCSLSEPVVRGLAPGSAAAAVLQKDIFASDLYNILLTSKNGKPRKREASRKVLKV